MSEYIGLGIIKNDERIKIDSEIEILIRDKKYKAKVVAILHRLNDDNEAELLSNEYANCLLDMWKQLNKYYAQNTINIPLLGSGITRILDNIEVSNQELLEIMLETLKISKMTFKEPSQINIILYQSIIFML